MRIADVINWAISSFVVHESEELGSDARSQRYIYTCWGDNVNKVDKQLNGFIVYKWCPAHSAYANLAAMCVCVCNNYTQGISHTHTHEGSEAKHLLYTHGGKLQMKCCVRMACMEEMRSV